MLCYNIALFSQMVKMKSDESSIDQETLAMVVLITGFNFQTGDFYPYFSLIAKCLSTFYWPFIETYNSEITPTVIRDSVFGLTRYLLSPEKLIVLYYNF